MSATGRGAERAERDYYPTPAWCVHRLLDRLDLTRRGSRWLEPCVGDGAIVRAVSDWCGAHGRPDVEWMGIDVHPLCEPAGSLKRVVQADFTWMDGAAWKQIPPKPEWDVCITNPPYGQAEAFVRLAKRHCDVVAVLLRLNWLAGGERCDWLQVETPDVYVLPNRPSFTGEGTDATDYGWLVWNRWDFTPSGYIQILDTTPLEERRAA